MCQCNTNKCSSPKQRTGGRRSGSKAIRLKPAPSPLGLSLDCVIVDEDGALMISNLATDAVYWLKLIAVSSLAAAACLKFIAGWTDDAVRARSLSQGGHAAAFFGCCIEFWLILNVGVLNHLGA